MKKRLKTLRAWGKLHPFSRNVLHGSAQFTAVWYLFAGFLHLTAGYTPDYFRAILYRDAALQVAPVTLRRFLCTIFSPPSCAAPGR